MLTLRSSRSQLPKTGSRGEHFLHDDQRHQLPRRDRRLLPDSRLIPAPWQSPSLCGPDKRRPSDGLFWGWTGSGEHLPPSLDLLMSRQDQPPPAAGRHSGLSPGCAAFADQARVPPGFLQAQVVTSGLSTVIGLSAGLHNLISHSFHLPC